MPWCSVVTLLRRWRLARGAATLSRLLGVDKHGAEGVVRSECKTAEVKCVIANYYMGLIVMSCGLVVAILSGPCGRVRVARLMRWWSSTGRRRRDAADRRVFLFLVLRN